MVNQYTYRAEWLRALRTKRTGILLEAIVLSEKVLEEVNDSEIRWMLEREYDELRRRARFDVLDLMIEHGETWRDEPESIWLDGLREEVDELASALNGIHDHTPEHELRQIAAICLNWLDMRAAR
jgi:hypothetical protein